MRSIFRHEKNKGGVYSDTFANISKRDTFLDRIIVTEEQMNDLNEIKVSKDNSSNSQ